MQTQRKKEKIFEKKHKEKKRRKLFGFQKTKPSCTSPSQRLNVARGE